MDLAARLYLPTAIDNAYPDLDSQTARLPQAGANQTMYAPTTHSGHRRPGPLSPDRTRPRIRRRECVWTASQS